jgi:hypothetical protein
MTSRIGQNVEVKEERRYFRQPFGVSCQETCRDFQQRISCGSFEIQKTNEAIAAKVGEPDMLPKAWVEQAVVMLMVLTKNILALKY